MSDTADASLVLAAVNPGDPLHARARRHLEGSPRLTIPLSVGIELLLVARKKAVSPVELLGATLDSFDVPDRQLLFAAAQALEDGDVPTPFDAVHLADAVRRGGRLHTADAALLRTAFPTAPF